MATPRRTQKQIAERYKGNLGYYKKRHPWRMARWCVSFLALAGGAAAIIAYQQRGREDFFSSGKISSNHAAFAQDCAKCHGRSSLLADGVTFAALKKVAKDQLRHGIDFTAIDLKCESCHQHHKVHQPNVVENRACSICHQEHLGPGRMKPAGNKDCAACHSSAAVMEASATKGAGISPAIFKQFRTQPALSRQIVFESPRPARGYTQVISSFADDHPEFQLIRDKARDPDVLRFNHQRHFAPDIPPVSKGRKLDCDYCHQPNPDGRFYQRVSFEANCKTCHALLFDKNNPQLQIPHGDVNLVRTFLRTLPAQYGDFARSKGKTGEADVRTFVGQQIRQLRDQFGSGEELERAVFFEKDPYKSQRQAIASNRANYAGCALCHDVKPDSLAVATLTKPILVDRWMAQANFNHAKHQVDPVTNAKLDCRRCHKAEASRETSDILMPVKADCVTCHSPAGKVTSDCTTCHRYHSPSQAIVSGTQAEAESFKKMLLGEK